MALATDYKDVFVKYIYDDHGMKWNVPVNAANMKHYPTRIGYLTINEKQHYSEEYAYSYLDVTSKAQVYR